MSAPGRLDRLPRASVRLGAVAWPVHRLFAVTGFVVGVGVIIALAGARDRDLRPIVSTLALAVTASLLWVRLRVALTGREAWVLLEHVYLAIGGSVLVSSTVAGAGAAAALLDPIAVGAAFGFAIGRCGCLIRGCCYGVACRVGLVYPPECHPDGPATRRLPVQGIEAALWAVLGLVGTGVVLTAPPGAATLVVLGAYAWGRFALDGLRGDPRPHLLGLSESRWLSLGLFAGLLLLRAGESAQATLVAGALVAATASLAALTWRRLVERAPHAGAAGPQLQAAALTLSRKIRQRGVHAVEVGELRVAASHTDGVLVLSIGRAGAPIDAGLAELALSALLRAMGLPDDLSTLTRSPGGLYVLSVPVAMTG